MNIRKLGWALGGLLALDVVVRLASCGGAGGSPEASAREAGAVHRGPTRALADSLPKTPGGIGGAEGRPVERGPSPASSAGARSSWEVRADLRTLQNLGRGLPRGDLARCGDLMRQGQAMARALRLEAVAVGDTAAAEAAIDALACVSCRTSALAACRRMDDDLE